MLCHRMIDYLVAHSWLPCNGEKALDHLEGVLEGLVLRRSVYLSSTDSHRRQAQPFRHFQGAIERVSLRPAHENHQLPRTNKGLLMGYSERSSVALTKVR